MDLTISFSRSHDSVSPVILFSAACCHWIATNCPVLTSHVFAFLHGDLACTIPRICILKMMIVDVQGSMMLLVQGGLARKF